MLLQLDSEEAINTDYIINLYIKKPEQVWLVIGKMIDGTMLILRQAENKNEAEDFYHTILNGHNERLKVLPASY